MAEFVQMTTDGLVLGTTLALFVLGFSLLMGVVGIINMAHAAFYAASGIAIWYLSQIMDFNYALTVVIVIVGMALIGIIVERLLYRPFRKDLMAGIVIAMGFMFFAQGAVANILREAGYDPIARRVPSIISGQAHFLGADISKERILIIVVSTLVISGVILFLNRTKMGWAVRATSMDEEASVLQGIHVGTVSMIVMAVACMLVALAAGLMTPVYDASPSGGFDWLMKGMIAIALGGLGSIGGTLSACLILGLVESYATTKIGGNEAMLILFAILAVILLIRPTGLAGKKILEETAGFSMVQRHLLKERIKQVDLRFFVPLVLALMVALPHIWGDRVTMSIYLKCMYLVVLCVGFRMITLTGRASIAQAAFMGVGAYASGLLALEHGVNPWIGLVVGGIAAGLLATVLGFISLRLSGIYFVIITLAFCEMIVRVINWQDKYTGGTHGRAGIPHFSIGGFDFGLDPEPYYYLLLFITVLALFVMYRMEHSRIGLALTAAGQNNLLAQHVGINVTRYRVLTWSVACFFAGIVGALWAHRLGVVQTSDYSVMESFWIMVYVFIGGVTSFWGPVVGAIGVTFLLEEITALEDWQTLVFGAIVIVIMLFFRGGLVSIPSTFVSWIKKIAVKAGRKKAPMIPTE